jgi:hypothetical protein
MESDMAGYRVYYGPVSGEYAHFIDVGNTTAYRLEGLEKDVAYYIAVTAYDQVDNESEFSEEVSGTVFTDEDDDGLPDLWELSHFGDIGQGFDTDFDGDGLGNGDEYLHGTDPTNADTDADQMPDGWEMEYGLDPLDGFDASLDSDSDGITNVDEYLRGTDPRNAPPMANAGPDQTVDEGIVVTLDGSNSSDLEGGIAAYFWEQTGGIPVTLSDLTAAQATFVSPDVDVDGVSLAFRLTVADHGGLEATDTCIVNVTWVNRPPVADAGPDQAVDEESMVTLNGSNSFDPDDGVAFYLWEQRGGPPVTLSDPTAPQPSFIAPDVGLDGGSLSFQLRVTDGGGLQSEDTCIVNVTWVNEPPVADAGLDQTVDEGTTVILDGFSSADPDDGIASYSWGQTDGIPVTLSDPTATEPTFVTPPVDGNEAVLCFRVTVTDFGGLQADDTVSIVVYDNGIHGFPSDVITFTASTGEAMGISVNSGGGCVRLKTEEASVIDDNRNRPEDLIYGLVEQHIRVAATGGTAVVRVYLPSPAPDAYTWYKYSPLSGWYDFSDHAVFGPTRDHVTVTLVDGGPGDEDGLANSVIVDCSALGMAGTGG